MEKEEELSYTVYGYALTAELKKERRK